VLRSAGERGDPIEVVPYDPGWRDRFGDLRARLTAALGPVATRIEHVGSTSVPGLAAKPVVDVQVSVADPEDESSYRWSIETLGFGLRWREPGHRYFRPTPGLPRLAQVHVCSAGSSWERDHILFRDYLRAHPQHAAEYAALKMELAARDAADRIAYTDAKGPFIVETLDRAEAWAARIGWSGSGP
jgi:GrpB-like predicted nucleotidyltransferase (UPF0157 family)